MALGAFLAGVLLADSEYRHELEADIEPFRGLLLGLFFMSVGMSVALELLVEHPFAIAGLVLGMTLLKTLGIGALGRRITSASGSRVLASVSSSARAASSPSCSSDWRWPTASSPTDCVTPWCWW